MRAAVLHEFNSALAIEDVADPKCPEGGVVLRVLACGVCRSDHHGWVGADPDIKLPHILGHEFCGEVVEARGVANWQNGDRVIAPFVLGCGICLDCRSGHSTICADQDVPGFTYDGAFAEYVAVPYADFNLARLPDALSAPLGAAMGCRVTTAWQALTARAEVKLGETVAIFGMGGVGLSAAILAKALGARVIAVDIVEEKLELARAIGADFTVNGAGNGTDHPATVIHELTGGGADVAIEALGIATTTNAAIASLRKLGRMVQIGMPVGEAAQMPIAMDKIYSGQLTLMGTRSMPAWRYPSLLELIERGQIDLAPLLRQEIALSGVTDALRAFATPAPAGIEVVSEFR